jgi:hypothetical protein
MNLRCRYGNKFSDSQLKTELGLSRGDTVSNEGARCRRDDEVLAQQLDIEYMTGVALLKVT